MTIVQYLTKSEAACCTSSELVRFSQSDKKGFEQLKEMAREEMTNRGIAIDVVVAEK